MRAGCFVLVVLAACGRDHFDPAHNFAFVTSTVEDPLTFGADFAGADAICRQRASDAGLLGDYVAYLGTNMVRPVDRLGNARGWVRMDGKPLADRVEDVSAGAFYYPLRIDENGEDVGSVLVATGRQRVGDGTPYHCNNWQDPARIYDAGTSDATLADWDSSTDTQPCTELAHLYCFGVGLDAPLVPTPVAGRRMFITVQGFAGGGGLTSADALCAQEAALAGVSGTFLAMLPTLAVSAISRFDLTGPTWVRMDGAELAATPLDFISGALETSPSISANGLPRRALVLSGGVAPGNTTSNTCLDWTGTTVISGGASWMSDGAAFHGGGADIDCSGAYPIYCFEP